MTAPRMVALWMLLSVSGVYAGTETATTALEKPAASTAEASGGSLMKAPKIENIVPLPISGMRAVVSNGELLYMSDNGRFIFRGVMYDAWAQKALKSLDEMRESINRIDLAKMGIKVDDFKPLQLGHGKDRITLFVDPKCPWCAKLTGQIKSKPELLSKYTFDLVVIPVLGEASQKLVREIGCAKDRKAALDHLVREDYSQTLESVKDCSLVAVQKSMVAAQILGVSGVPFMIHSDGRVQSGMPKELENWLEARK